jgi:aspartate carbamoyltransferase catalytic subunit
VALIGDLKNGRTVHSLARALAHWNVTLLLASPPTLTIGDDLAAQLRAAGTAVEEHSDLQNVIPRADVLYVTRIQKERFADPAEYERLRSSYVVDRALLAQGPAGMTVMHPLPRVNEIAVEVDALPNAAYFRQAANGVWVRMALLAAVLDKMP